MGEFLRAARCARGARVTPSSAVPACVTCCARVRVRWRRRERRRRGRRRDTLPRGGS